MRTTTPKTLSIALLRRRSGDGHLLLAPTRSLTTSERSACLLFVSGSAAASTPPRLPSHPRRVENYEFNAAEITF